MKIAGVKKSNWNQVHICQKKEYKHVVKKQNNKNLK
jgi:hypothetical protein